jgi:hypothetical protein
VRVDANQAWPHDLSTSVGNVLVRQGKLYEALKLYRDGPAELARRIATLSQQARSLRLDDESSGAAVISRGKSSKEDRTKKLCDD